ncbi:MAG: adaptor protein [Paenibacillaceae bacterium ZCTH02-B3]|nr:MAG: adaptor protein [Paenibacillaceae bacterium ZCTH02-B3]
MRMERLGNDKIRIFLTFDDLSERGIQKEDLWREIPKVHELFSEMMDQAYNELGFDATGPLAVEVFAMPAQGMVVVVTRGKIGADDGSAADDELDEEMFEIEVSLERTDAVTYRFLDIEDAIGAARRLIRMTRKGRLYRYRDAWILRFEPADLPPDICHNAVAVLAEYGEAVTMTKAVLDEYGQTVIPEGAVGVLARHFS